MVRHRYRDSGVRSLLLHNDVTSFLADLSKVIICQNLANLFAR